MARAQDKAKVQYWRRLLQERGKSGLSVAAFCQERHVAVHQFYWWQRRLRRHDGNTQPTASNNDGGFIPVRVPLYSPSIEVVHPGGCLIRVVSGVEAKLLRCVLDALNPAEA